MSARSVVCAFAVLAGVAQGAEPEEILPGLPAWPEEVGALAPADHERALAELRELARGGTTPERLAQTRYRRALLDLAPLPGRDVARARQELAAVARAAGSRPWDAAARYALAWIEELEGSSERARAAYRALVLEDPWSAVARRAGTAVGRLELRRDQPAEAAVWLQAAIDRGGAPGSEDLRESALRGVLHETSGASVGRVVAARSSVTELREASALARSAEGDVIVADRKRGLVVRFEGGDRPARTWPLAGVTALAVDPYGRTFAAASGTILRLDGDVPTVVARSGPFGAVSALAVDAAGRIWIADRRGDRVGIARADGGDPAVVRGKRDARVSALAWDGRDVVALEASSGRVIALASDGSVRVVAELHTPVGLAANGAGSLALLDERGGIVVLSATGKILERLDPKAAGVARPLALALGLDGSIDCFDGADGRSVRLH